LESACSLKVTPGAKRRFNLATDSCQIASAGPLPPQIDSGVAISS
jgi:hypothetical protein